MGVRRTVRGEGPRVKRVRFSNRGCGSTLDLVAGESVRCGKLPHAGGNVGVNTANDRLKLRLFCSLELFIANTRAYDKAYSVSQEVRVMLLVLTKQHIFERRILGVL